MRSLKFFTVLCLLICSSLVYGQPTINRIWQFRDSVGLVEWEDPNQDQLKCLLLKISHHGSKRGTSFEYLERLKPNHIVITAGNQQWYKSKKSSKWLNKFPDQLIMDILWNLNKNLFTSKNNYNKSKFNITGIEGNIIYKFKGTNRARLVKKFTTKPTDPNFLSDLISGISDGVSFVCC